MKKRLIYALILIALGYASCIEKPVYPTTPEIGYKDFIRYGANPLSPDSAEVVISFTDNEGDIGLEQTDTQGVFNEGNVWLVYYYDSANLGTTWAAWDTSIASSVPFDTLKYFYRVPPVLPEGDPAEPMKGLIYVKLYTKDNGISTIVHDKIKFGVYMFDKAMNKSNVIETPPLDFEP